MKNGSTNQSNDSLWRDHFKHFSEEKRICREGEEELDQRTFNAQTAIDVIWFQSYMEDLGNSMEEFCDSSCVIITVKYRCFDTF